MRRVVFAHTNERDAYDMEASVTAVIGPDDSNHLLRRLTDERQQDLLEFLRLHLFAPEHGIPEGDVDRILPGEFELVRALAEVALDTVEQRQPPVRERARPAYDAIRRDFTLRCRSTFDLRRVTCERCVVTPGAQTYRYGFHIRRSRLEHRSCEGCKCVLYGHVLGEAEDVLPPHAREGDAYEVDADVTAERGPHVARDAVRCLTNERQRFLREFLRVRVV